MMNSKAIFVAIAVLLASVAVITPSALAQTATTVTTTSHPFHHFGHFGFFNRGLLFQRGLLGFGLGSTGLTTGGGVVILSQTPGAQVFANEGVQGVVNPCGVNQAFLSNGSCVSVAEADAGVGSGQVIQEQTVAPAVSSSVVVPAQQSNAIIASGNPCASTIASTPVIVSTGSFGGLLGGFDNFGGFHHGFFHHGDHVRATTTTTTAAPAS